MLIVEPFISALFRTRSRSKVASEVVLWKEVEEGWVRYDQFSGSTHLISPLARFVIELIEESIVPLSSSHIVESVLSVEQDVDPVDCLVEVESVLRVLSEAQLVEPIRP